MKVVFIDKDPVAKQGVMALCAYLKRHGHGADVLLDTVDVTLRRSIDALRPGLVAFSCTTGRHVWAEKVARELGGASGIPTLLGGPHATFFPEALQGSAFDYLCRGEGEEPLLELVEALEAGETVPRVANIWVKRNGQVLEQEVRALQEDLDVYPFVDRSVYYKYPVVRDFHMDHFSFVTGRGCPYSCAFCYNVAGKALYKGKGRYVRKRSVEHCIAELAEARERYPVRRVVFEDDTFILKEGWTLEFLAAYAGSVGLPFIGNTRADQVTPEIVRALKAAGCTGVKIGVEAGDADVRNRVLRKGIPDEAYRQAARLFHDAGIDIQSFNMVGIPGATLEHDWKTVRFNAELGVKHAWCSIMSPYPKTEIMERACEAGWLERDEIRDGFFPESYFMPSKMRIPDKRRVTNLHHLFNLCVRYPRLEPLFRLLTSLPLEKPFELFFKIHHALSLRGYYRFRWRSYFRFLWYCRRMY